MENWRPVLGWEGLYEVSDLGRVRSLARDSQLDSLGRHRSWPGVLLKPVRHTDGYNMVSLWKNSLGGQEFVHRLVAFAFLGSPLFSPAEVNHINGDKSDSRLANIEWVTPRANKLHARATGLWSLKNPSRGEAHYRARLTEADVRSIRSRYAAGESTRAIAADLAVSLETVKAAAHRKTWRHVA